MNKNKKVVSLCLSLALMLGLTTPALALSLEHTTSEGETIKLTDFLDTKGHWAYTQIYKWGEYGLIAGNNGYFMPDSPIKRGDLAIIIDRMLGLKTTTYNFYNDLPSDSYYRDAVLRCVAAGYITGTGTNTVSPEGFATREQVAVIITRMLNLDIGFSGSTGFNDDSSIGSWAKSSIYAMKRLGYMNGNNAGNVMPQSYITRAELVTILSNIANTYIPKSDKTGQGNAFTGQYPTNIVTSRNIELSNATVGRDVVLTQASSNFTATNTKIMGRIYVMGKNNVILDNTSTSQIYLVDGKSTITGISDAIDEIYIAKYATESSLDEIPKCVTLESGVRVKIGDTMYENTTNRTKTYYGIDIKADIADEQNYVVGGPRITGAKFAQDQDNTISVSNVIVNKNGTEIDEIGVIWLDQENNTDVVNPSYQNYDGKKVYHTNKFTDPLSFTVDTLDGTRAYRVYVKDSDGLFAYSDTTVFSEYEYSIDLNIYGESYPEKVDTEIIMEGDSIPEISSIRVVYGYDDLYNEDLDEITLRLYSNPDAEYQPDSSKYRRYIGTISSKSERVDGETIYTPPTHFGYIINFKNGTIINKYPVLSNAIPSGVSPMSELITGSASYSGNSILISNNKVTTRYAIPQEVGVVYRVSDSTYSDRPTADAQGWTRVKSSVSVGLNESVYFNSSIPTSKSGAFTYYAAYVKTSNGYWYGDVQKISNNAEGDVGGPIIKGINNVVSLNSTSAVVSASVSGISRYEDIDLGNSYVLVGNNKIYLSDKNVIMRKVDSGLFDFYIHITDLSASASTNAVLCLVNTNGLKSNTSNVSINTNSHINVTAQNTNSNYYTLNFSHGGVIPYDTNSGSSIMSGSASGIVIERAGKVYNMQVLGKDSDENVKISLRCKYIPDDLTNGFLFDLILDV